MEVIMKILDNRSHSVNMVHQSTLVCSDCGANDINSSFSLSSTHMVQPTDVSYVNIYL